jgi:hypothetical protein
LNNSFNEIFILYLQGRTGEAHDLAVQMLSNDLGNEKLFSIITKLRQEMLVQDSRKILNDNLSIQSRISTIQSRISNSISQSLVLQILQDKKYDNPKRLERYGYSTASQNEEDGMLAEIFRRIGETNRVFFEFGVGSGIQNITFNLLLSGWKGFWIEIDQPKFEYIKSYFRGAINSKQLVVDDTHVNAENINKIINDLGIPQSIDLLSIDIDGNDYHVFKAIKNLDPRVVVLEYNPIYPPPMKIVGAYDANYKYSEETYIGASLQSLVDLLDKKGYQLVGTSIGGVNAIFVKKELAKNKFYEPATAKDLFHQARYQLSFTGGFGAWARPCFGKLHDEEP